MKLLSLIAGIARVCALSSVSRENAHNAALTVRSPDESDLGTTTINQIENQIISFARMTEKNNMTTATQDMKAFIAIFNNKIDGKMIPYLFNQTRMSKANVEAKYDKVKECAMTRDSGEQKNERVEQKQNFEVTLSTEHIECRKNQATQLQNLNSNKDDRVEKTTNRERLCAIKAEVEGYKCQKTICDEGASYDGSREALKKFVELAKEWRKVKLDCENAKEAEELQIKKVADLQEKYDKKLGECDEKQRATMTAQCKWRLNTFAHDVEYIGCYQEAKNAYEDATWRAGKAMNKRKHEYRALQRIKCLLVGLADGNVAKLNSQIIYCRAQKYSGKEMVFELKDTPKQNTMMKLVETPCETRKRETEEKWKYWMKEVPVPLLIDCTPCELPPTPKPTPVPTPPPPPGKVKCEYRVKEELINVRYNNSNVKLVGTRMWPTWHVFEFKHESGMPLELEAKGVGEGDCSKQGTLALRCKGTEKVGSWEEYDITNGYVVVAGGDKKGAYDKPAMAPCYETYKKVKGAWYPAMSTKYVKFTVGPDYDTTCWTAADNELVSVKYGGQLVGMEGMKPDLAQAYSVKVFKFNFVMNSTIEIVAMNNKEEKHSCDTAGFGLTCESAWPQWDKYDTSKGNLEVAPSKDGQKFGKLDAPCTSSGNVARWSTDKVPKPPSYVWTKDETGQYAKFIIKGNTVKA